MLFPLAVILLFYLNGFILRTLQPAKLEFYMTLFATKGNFNKNDEFYQCLFFQRLVKKLHSIEHSLNIIRIMPRWSSSLVYSKVVYDGYERVNTLLFIKIELQTAEIWMLKYVKQSFVAIVPTFCQVRQIVNFS